MILPKDQMEEHTAIGVNALSPSDKLIRAPLGAVKVVTSIASVAMIEVKAGGSDSVAEVTRRVMDVMHREGIQVRLLSVFSTSKYLQSAICECCTTSCGTLHRPVLSSHVENCRSL
jgi:hypothetical protein